jgi:hypothetical protein
VAAWTPGEDIETGRTALALRMRIRHLDMVVHTDAPDTWRALVDQRRLWWAGAFRHWWINFDRNLIHLSMLASYYLIAIWASWYFKVWTFTTPSEVLSDLPLVYMSYLFVTVTSNLQVLSPWMLVFPFCALAQVLVLPPLGGAVRPDRAEPAASGALPVRLPEARSAARGQAGAELSHWPVVADSQEWAVRGAGALSQAALWRTRELDMEGRYPYDAWPLANRRHVRARRNLAHELCRDLDARLASGRRAGRGG